MSKTAHFTNVDNFIFSLRESGETIGDQTFMQPGVYHPGEADPVNDDERRYLSRTVGVVIYDCENRVSIEYYQNRAEWSERRTRAIHLIPLLLAAHRVTN
jgi:hypothetical protein